MEVKRLPYQGVLNVLSFNRHFYIIGLSALVIIMASIFFISWNTVLYSLITFGISYGLFIPIIVSWYVYDYSNFYDLDWIKRIYIENSYDSLILNINAGFDETSHSIDTIFPKSKLQAFDFYDPNRHTEKAIVRARKVSIGYPNTQQITSHHIPLSDGSVDAIFLLMSLHEIRQHQERIDFLKECKRVCNPSGNVIMVEHLRDLPNFLAFTIGFTHFFSKNTWMDALKKAGFTSIKESKFTPFLSIYNCQ